MVVKRKIPRVRHTWVQIPAPPPNCGNQDEPLCFPELPFPPLLSGEIQYFFTKYSTFY